MPALRPFLRATPLAILYFVAASSTIAFTRSGDGVACLWWATGILTANLVHRPRRRWPALIAGCAVASMLATSLFGFGAAMAAPFAAINMAEAVIGAELLRRMGSRGDDAFDALGWFVRLCFAVGIVAPLAVSLPAALIAQAFGQPWGHALLIFFTGHALGGLTVTPLALVFATAASRRNGLRALRAKGAEGIGLLLLVALVTLVVFWQDRLPLLFLPILPMILATFRGGREAAAISVLIVATIGGFLTLHGSGPAQLMAGDGLSRELFLQFYVASTVLTILPVAADLHSRKRVTRALAVSEQRFRLIAEHSSDVLIHLDVAGTILYISPSIATLGGYDPDALIGQHASLLIASDHREAVADHHAVALRDRRGTHFFDYEAVMADGGKRWFESHVRAIVDEQGRAVGSLSIVRDVQGRKDMEERLTRAAFTDVLTGLPNRRAFRDEAERRARAARTAGSDCIALFDLDHFKRINDLYGHDAGDRVLCHFAQVTRSLLREKDMVARVGGEEFVALLPDTGLKEAMRICDRVRRELSLTPLIDQNRVIRVTISGGVARMGLAGVDEALKIADLALYEAKEGGRDRLILAA